MATKRTTKASTKAAVLDEDIDETEATTEAELTPKQIINAAIGRVVEATGVDVQKNRYKAMRAIAYTAFVNAINDGTFDDLVDQAIAEADELPSGWELEKPAKEDAPAPKAKAAPAKKAPAKKAAAAPAKPARKRPTR